MPRPGPASGYHRSEPPHEQDTMNPTDTAPLTSRFPTPIDDRYFEDYVPGAVHRFGEMRVTEQEIVDFARRYDPQDFHTDPAKAAEHYIKAVDNGLLKVMSKMGIPTLRSYRSAQIFEAVGIAPSVVDRYFPGTASRIGGIGMAEIAAECTRRHAEAEARAGEEVLPAGGQYRFRQDGENHLWSPQSLSLFRQAVQTNDVAKYRQYAGLINEQAERLCTLLASRKSPHRPPFSFLFSTNILEDVEKPRGGCIFLRKNVVK